MKKSALFIVAAALLIAVIAGLFVFSLKPASAQTTYWERYCPDRIRAVELNPGYDVTCYNRNTRATYWTATCPARLRMSQQNGGLNVTCYDPNSTPPTATLSGPTATPTRGATATPTRAASATPTRAATATPAPSGSILVDHNSVALFDRIPSTYLTAARNLKVLFSDRSVGVNFDQALDCLTASSFGAAPAYCRRSLDANRNILTYSQADLDAGRVPAYLAFFPSASLYNRSNWHFEERTGEWDALTCDFIQSMAPANLDKNVLSYQFSYLNVGNGNDIDKFWLNNANRCDIYDLEAFIAQHPDKTFIFWTTSLSRQTGTQISTDFNNRMRQYARDNRKILFDFADIEAHDPNGQPCYDNRDGVPYTSPSSGSSENYPNDGQSQPAICADYYTTEVDGGHLGSTSAGRVRLAKAFWVLMAQIAGWRP